MQETLKFQSALEADLTLRPGTLRDYAALAEYHYRAARPATVTRVLVLEHQQPSATERFRALLEDRRVPHLGVSEPAADREGKVCLPAAGGRTRTHLVPPFPMKGSRCGTRPASHDSPPSKVVAVLVESRPVLSCYARDAALGGRYAELRDVRERARRVNAEIRCISRVVVHPQWRGLGLAVRLVRAALASPATIFTEALAAMGQVNPFFARAGMKAYYPPPRHAGRPAPVYYLCDHRARP